MKGPGLTGFQKRKGSSASQTLGVLYLISLFCTLRPSPSFARLWPRYICYSIKFKEAWIYFVFSPSLPLLTRALLFWVPQTRRRACLTAEGGELHQPAGFLGCLSAQLRDVSPTRDADLVEASGIHAAGMPLPKICDQPLSSLSCIPIVTQTSVQLLKCNVSRLLPQIQWWLALVLHNAP